MEEHKEKIEPTPSVILQPSFDLIFELLDSKEVLINIPKYNIQQQPAVLNRNINNGFTLTIKIANTTINWLEPCEIEIYINKNIYITSNFYITKMGYICTGQIQGLHLKNATHIELYNRFAICTQNTPIIDYYINTTRYNDESTRHLYGRLPITVGNKHLILYESKVRDLDYFIIDSKDLIDSKEFSDICYSIMIGIGFISANFIQDEAFYFKSKEPDFSELTDFSYLKLRQSIISGGFYNPIYSNPYGYTDKDTTIVNEIGSRIDVFNPILFSSFCDKIYSNQDYAILILLILEANVSSLILKPAGYAVALEKITNIIVKENKDLKPILNKQISKEFTKKLNEVLDSFKDKITEVGNTDSITILRKNIDNINQPTNRDKLTKPFQIYGIKLEAGDLSAIDNRNKLLHGRNKKKNSNDSNDFNEIWHISMRLNKLINKLILKHIGYSGYIVNHIKHNERSLGIEIKESLFEKI